MKILIGLLLVGSVYAQSKVVVNPFPPGSGLELVPTGGGSGSGTVTSVAIAGTTNQITATGTCTITTAGTCTLSLPSGLILPGTVNGLTITTTTGTITIASAKVLTVSNSLTLAGTDGVTLTFPTTSATIARTDAGQTFTGNQTMTALLQTGSTAPTQTQADNSTKVATTAYVDTGLATKGAGTVTNVATACGLTGGPITTTGTISQAITPAAHNGSYAILTTDCGLLLSTNVAAAWTIAQAGTTGFESGKFWRINNVGSGSLTITATTSTFYGGPTAQIVGSVLTIAGSTGVTITSDGANYQVVAGSGAPTGTAGGDLGGTYPNPTVTSGAHITNASIPNSGLATVTQSGAASSLVQTDSSGNIRTAAGGIGSGISSFGSTYHGFTSCWFLGCTATSAGTATPTFSPNDQRYTYTGAATAPLAQGSAFNVYLDVNPSTSSDNHNVGYAGINSIVYADTTTSVLASIVGGQFTSLNDKDGSLNTPIGVLGNAISSGGDGAYGVVGTATNLGNEGLYGDVQVAAGGTKGYVGVLGTFSTYKSTSFPGQSGAGLYGYGYVDSGSGGIAVLYSGLLELAGTMSKVTNAYGLYVRNVSGAANLNMAIRTNAGTVQFGDDTVVGKNLVGGLAVASLATPVISAVASGCPSGGKPFCTNDGTKTYSYKVVAVFKSGQNTAASAQVSTATGYDNLATSGQGNIITITPVEGAVVGYDVYRTVAGGSTTNTTGKIGTAAQDVYPQFACCSMPASAPIFNDTGQAGDSASPPSGNSTGFISQALHTVGDLPACSSSYDGFELPVTDSLGNAWGTTITAGGSAHVKAYCNGSRWTIQASQLTPVTDSFSATPTFNAANPLHTITLTGDVTSSTLSNLAAGETVQFLICQDATGSRAFTWPTNIKGGMTIGTTASKCNAQNFTSWDGTTAYAVSQGVINQ